MPYCKLEDGTKIHYLKKGRGKKKLVLVHGNLANTIWWETTLNHLPKDYQAFALDLPGSGKSPETGKRHTIDYFSEVLKEFVESMGLKNVYLIGHSMGGGVSQLFTLKYPEKVIKLVLLDSMSADGFHVLFNQEERLKRMRVDLEFLKKAIRNIAPKCKDEVFLERASMAAFKASEQVFLEQPITMHESNWMKRLSEIKCPVLFLHGDQDDFVPKDGSERTAKAIPGCTFKYLKNCGHSPMAEVFEDYFKEVFQFLE